MKLGKYTYVTHSRTGVYHKSHGGNATLCNGRSGMGMKVVTRPGEEFDYEKHKHNCCKKCFS